MFWHRLQKEVHSTSNMLLRISSENTASYFNSETCKIMIISSRLYQDWSKALNFSCESFLCKFCLDYLMKYDFFFSKPSKDWSLCCILRVFWHAVSWMTIIWLDYWSKFVNCEERERNSIYIIVTWKCRAFQPNQQQYKLA